jgi:hypothetical protein
MQASMTGKHDGRAAMSARDAAPAVPGAASGWSLLRASAAQRLGAALAALALVWAAVWWAL